MTDWNKIRKDFPITENSVYFQSAAMSPMPSAVFKAIMKEYEKLHLHGDIGWINDMKRFNRLCKESAELLNTDPENVTFVQNTSTAISLLALSFKNQIPKPFNVVSMKDEFPASTVGFEYLNVEMRYVEPVDSRNAIDSILETIDKDTLAVVTSQIQYSTGFQQDLMRLGQELKKHGILFIVNSTQAFPYFPVDVAAANIDVLTASLHKWGLTGHIGTLFFTTPEFREKFPSPWAGWLSVDMEGKGLIYTAKNSFFQLLASAHRYDFGTFNLQPLLAFQKALNYIKDIGIQNIQERIMELTDYLIEKLKELNIKIVSPIERKSERSAIISFTLDDKNKACIQKCNENKIYVSQRDGKIRVSVNIFNNFTDIDHLVTVLRDFRG